jgi:hypothetical protein
LEQQLHLGRVKAICFDLKVGCGLRNGFRVDRDVPGKWYTRCRIKIMNSLLSAVGADRFEDTTFALKFPLNRQHWDLLCCLASPLRLNGIITLMLMKTLILAVSAYDLYLTVKYFESLPQMEQNLIGRWLLQFDNGPVSGLQQAAAFITAKFTGNVIVMVVLEALAFYRFRLVGVVAASVAFAQVILGLYLYFGVNSN